MLTAPSAPRLLPTLGPLANAGLATFMLPTSLLPEFSSPDFTAQEKVLNASTKCLITGCSPASQFDQDAVGRSKPQVGSPAVFPVSFKAHRPSVDVDPRAPDRVKLVGEKLFESETAGSDEA